MFAFTTSIQFYTGVLGRTIAREKDIKDIHIWEEEVKQSLFVDDMILFVEKPKEPIKVYWRDFPGGTVVKNPPASAGDTSSNAGLGRSHMPRSN